MRPGPPQVSDDAAASGATPTTRRKGSRRRAVQHWYRGCYRYVKEPDLFALELDVLARVREQTPNLHLMIPFVRTRWELAACLDLVDPSPLGRQRGLHRWVMAEVPSVVARSGMR